MQHQYNVVCGVCGQPFHASPAALALGTKHCSLACRRIGKARKWIDRTCAYCATQFRANPDQVRLHKARFCSLACARAQRYGATRNERFWSKVNKDGPVPTHRPDLGPCWVWTAGGNGNGYGSFCFEKQKWAAHRFSYELHYGSLAADLLVCHRCDTPACVRPDHLFLGTQTDNMGDCATKGRIHRGFWLSAPSGLDHPTTKLTASDVRAIRARFSQQPRLTYTAVAKEYDVNISTIRNVVLRFTFRDVAE